MLKGYHDPPHINEADHGYLLDFGGDYVYIHKTTDADFYIDILVH